MRGLEGRYKAERGKMSVSVCTLVCECECVRVFVFGCAREFVWAGECLMMYQRKKRDKNEDGEIKK